MNWKLTLAALFLVGVGLGTFGYFKIISPPDIHSTVAKQKPDFELTADALYNDFDADADAANSKYLGKTIKLSGTVGEMSALPESRMLVRLELSDPMGSVSAEFGPDEKAKLEALSVGSALTLKGTCTGANAGDDLLAALGTDVQLKPCVVLGD